MASQSSILRQARQIMHHAEALVHYLEKNKLEEFKFEVDSPLAPDNREYDDLRLPLTQAAQDLLWLANGPLQWLRTFFCTHHDLAAWQVALRMRVFDIVPFNEPISVRDIATAAQMDEGRLRSVLKFLATQRCFHEVEEDLFAHTALSAYIARNKDIEAAISFQADEMFQAASSLADCIQKEPYKSDPLKSAFALRHGTPPYQWYAAHPEKAARFAAAMAGYGRMNRDHEILRESFPWDSLQKTTVVDVGGGSGHISMYLAQVNPCNPPKHKQSSTAMTRFVLGVDAGFYTQQFPKLEFIVQDVDPNMLSQGPKNPSFPMLGGRVTFMQHDFFQSQPISGETAGLYFIRQILHNYTDEDAVRILRVLVPALEKGGASSSVLINDMILPPANTLLKVEEHGLRQIDIAMLDGYAAKQRSLQEFTTILKEADRRYEIMRVHADGMLGLLEVRLQLQQP